METDSPKQASRIYQSLASSYVEVISCPIYVVISGLSTKWIGCRQVTKYVFWTGLFLYAFGPTVTISFGDDEDEDEEQGQEGVSTTNTNSDAAKNDDDAPEAVLPGSIAMTEGRPFFLPLTFVRERPAQLGHEDSVELDAINKALDNPQSIIEIKRRLSPSISVEPCQWLTCIGRR